MTILWRSFLHRLVETRGEEQAERYLHLINQSFRKIADNPGLGRPIDAIRKGYRKYGVGRHLIFYRANDAEIDLVRILLETMDVDRHM